MAKSRYRNISPLGALDVPLLGRIVEADEVFEVDVEFASAFDGQVGTFEKVGRRAPAATEPTNQPVAPSGEGDTSEDEDESGEEPGDEEQEVTE